MVTELVVEPPCRAVSWLGEYWGGTPGAWGGEYWLGGCRPCRGASRDSCWDRVWEASCWGQYWWRGRMATVRGECCSCKEGVSTGSGWWKLVLTVGYRS